jgi:hypothetical protein
MAEGQKRERSMMHPRLAIGVIALTLWAVVAYGQAAERSRPFAWDVARAVLIDPTTFAPAVIAHQSMMQDWKTSQVLFANGWLEVNPRFTASGLPNDVPLSYGAGVARIHTASLQVLLYSGINNTASRIGERMLISRYPSHKRLIRTLGWIERIGYASFIAYQNSADHLRQSKENRRLARVYGYSP